jgi:hypothetical protein
VASVPSNPILTIYVFVFNSLDIILIYNIMSFSIFNSFNGNSQRLGQKYSIVSADVNPPGSVSSIGTDTSSVTFSFTAPRTGGTVTGYTAYVDGKPYSGTGGPSSYTINGLSAGVQYSINMVANIVSSSTTITTTSVTFAPTSVTGCSLWLDAADTATITYSSGSNVSQWSDKSGLGNNATQSTSTYQPISGSVSTNGKNVLNFTGKSMIYPTINNTTITVFCIYNNKTFVPYGTPVNVGPFAFFYAAPNSKVGIGRLAVTDEVLASWSSAGLTTSQYVIYGGTVSVSGNTTSFLYFNGTQVATVSVNSSGGISAYSVGDSINNITSGNIAEVLIYNSVLSTTDRQKVEGYLAWKWGLQTSLPGAHPYYGAAPSGGTSTVTTTTSKNILSNPSRPLVISTLAPFPTNIQLISATTTSLTFSFTAPTTGSTPSSYTPYVNGSASTGSGTPSSYAISGLTAGTSYQITMAANVGGGTFVPTSISGCTAWWDGADPNGTGVLPANGASITTWADKSGNGYNATASSAATYSLSSKSVTFSNNYYTSNHPATPTNETCFIVYNVTNTNGYMFMIGTAVGGREVGLQDSKTSVAMGNSYISWGAVSTGVGTVGQSYLVTGQISNGPSNTYISVNGALTLVGPTAMGSSFTNGVTTGLGRENLVSGPFYGNIMEVLFYNSVLSTSDRQKVEGYLAWKWNIQSNLPGAHPYYSSSPNTGIVSYQNPNPVSLTTLYTYPTNIQFISATTTSLTISFTAPGNSPTGYTPYVNGSAGTGSGTPSSYTISGLTGGTSYSVTIGANVTTTTTFTPTSISGCSAWWDASDPYGTGTPPANGTAISTWTDKSGSGYNGIAQSGLSATYTSASNTLNFNNAYYTTNYPANPTYETFFMVFNYTNASAEMVPIGSTSGGRIIYIYNQDYSVSTSYAAGSSNSSGLATNGTNNLIVTAINTNANAYASTNAALTMNGPNTIGAFGAGTKTYLGRDAYPHIFYGNVCEIIFYNSVLSATDRQKVEGYLAWKWGLQTNLPSTHPYYSAAPTGSSTTTTYQNPSSVSLRTATVPVTYTYQYTGSNQSVVVPTGTTYMVAELWGAGGGGSGNGSNSAVYNVISGSGGGGGYTSANLIISAGTTLTIIVGQAGNVSAIAGQALATYGGGGGCITLNGDTNWRNTSGGGRSAIQISGADIITAGGGGGGGHIAPSAPNPATGTYMTGGAGGGLIGGTGGFGDSSGTEQNGKGGTQSAGGAAGSNKPGGNPSTNGTAGSQYQGGTGTSSGAGGGGGWYGGGGSNFSALVTYYLGSGGGGSSYVSSSYLQSGTTATLLQASGATVASNSSLPSGVQGTIGNGGAGSTTGSAGQNGYAVITFYFT